MAGLHDHLPSPKSYQVTVPRTAFVVFYKGKRCAEKAGVAEPATVAEDTPTTARIMLTGDNAVAAGQRALPTGDNSAATGRNTGLAHCLVAEGWNVAAKAAVIPARKKNIM